jgi:Protein of unknown function (DUF1570)
MRRILKIVLIATALLTVPLLAQTTGPANPAADLSAYGSQHAALQPDDIPGRLALAHWAITHELWTQAGDMAHEILDRDPDNRVAWNILQQIDGVVLLPEDKAVEDGLKAEFLRRFNHDFKTRNTRHFLICYDTTDAFASQRGAALEKGYDAFLFNFNMRKIRPGFLSTRLVVILLKNRDDYLAYAKQTEGADLSWAAGYYSQHTNRTAFYDDSTGPSAESAEQALAELRAKLKDLTTQIARATSQNQTSLASSLTIERNRTSQAVTQIDLRVNNAVGMLNNVKTVHEAAHQLAFNTDIQTRYVDYPLWFSEGLACCFEIEDSAHHRGPGMINTARIGVIKDALHQGKLIPLDTFIAHPQPAKMDDATLNLFYAESWGLFHYLYRTNRAGLENYMLAYKELPTWRAVLPEQRLQLFVDAFGNDFPSLQKNFTAYMKNLPPRTP